MRYVIVDLEATCWKKGSVPERMEIIEIGAVMLKSASGPVFGEFSEFVKPAYRPVLSAFCKELTSIRQEDVAGADEFRAVFGRFMDWIGDESFSWCSWGAYDIKQLRIECDRHGLDFSESLEQHLNLKNVFAKLKGVKPRGMRNALSMLGISMEGTHHRGIDDARNIAKIAELVLPYMEEWK
jgi:3'-5' exoribonuclease 1